MELSGVLVTGGAGFIGSEAVRQLVPHDRFKKIFIVDKLTYAGDLNRITNEINKSNVDFIEADVNEVDKYRTVLSECSAVIHFAAESHVDRSIENGMPFLKSNVLGTFSLLNATKDFTQIRNLVVSTDEVYGSFFEGEAKEETILNPSSQYSASKASSDLIAMAQHLTHNQDILITRCSNNYGLYQASEKAIPTFIESALFGRNIPVYGSGINIREWIHVSDHVKGIFKVLDKGNSGEIYNIGTSDRLSNVELAKIILGNLHLNEDKIEFVEDRKGHDLRYALNSSKIRRNLGWEPEIDFYEGITKTIQWYKGNMKEKGN